MRQFIRITAADDFLFFFAEVNDSFNPSMKKTLINQPARGGRGTTIPLDSAARDRLVHGAVALMFLAQNLPGETLKRPAPGVLVRRALQLYSERVDALLRSGDPDELDAELRALERCARGDETKLDARSLLAVPPRPYAELRAASARETADLHTAGLRRFIEQKECE